MSVADRGEALRHRSQREVLRVGSIDLVPVEWRGDPRVGSGSYRISRRDRAIFRVLIVVDEHPLPLFLPPFAGCNTRRTTLHFARQGQRRTPDLVEPPPGLDPHEEMHAARAGGLGPTDQANILERRARDMRHWAQLRS